MHRVQTKRPLICLLNMSAEKVFVSGATRFAGTIKITTNSDIDNRANLNYLLTHSCLDYTCNIL
ncbi:hypothetical protein ABGL63_004463, partial [Escherichia coli]